MVDDRYQVSQTLTGTGAGGQNIVLLAPGCHYRLFLVMVESEGSALLLEDIFAQWMENAGIAQLGDVPFLLVGRVELHKGFWPEGPC